MRLENMNQQEIRFNWFKAIRRGEIKRMKEILPLLKDVDERTKDFKRTGLHFACQEGYLDIVQELLRHGANPNAQDCKDCTPLHLAVVLTAQTSSAIVHQLIEAGANVGATTKEHKSALSLACARSAQGVVKTLLKNSSVDPSDPSPLIVACGARKVEAVKDLLDLGIQIDASLRDGLTALHQACQRRYVPGGVLDELLKRGANVNMRTRKCWSPLHYACRFKEFEAAQILLEHGASVDAQTNVGYTSLHISSQYCKNGRLDFIQLLLKYGANIDAVSRAGHTPLQIACKHNQEAIVKEFLKRGASMEIKQGFTLLQSACRARQLNLVTLLVDHGADPNGTSKSSLVPPLHNACQRGFLEIAEVLIERGADVEAVTEAGWTALHYACFEGRTNITKMLLTKVGVNIHAVNNDGWTPLHSACANNPMTFLVRMLLDHGASADMRKTTRDGLTPLQLALQSGRLNVIMELLGRGGVTELLELPSIYGSHCYFA